MRDAGAYQCDGATPRVTRFVCFTDLPSPRVIELVARFESQANQPQSSSQGDREAMNRTSKDRPNMDDGASSSSSSTQRSDEPRVLPRAVSADDGALKKAALQVEKDLAGVEIPEVTSAAAINAAATASIRSTPPAAGQLQPEGPASSTEPSRLSSAALRALDAETAMQGVSQQGSPASLAVQPAESRRGTGDSVAEPLPKSAYATKQPSRFAKSQDAPTASYSDSESVASDSEAAPMAAGSAKPSGKAADAMGLTVAVKAASRMRTDSDLSQDNADNSPSSARPLLAGPSSSALAAIPGSVHESPKGSEIGFMPLPAHQNPLQSQDFETRVSPACLQLVHILPTVISMPPATSMPTDISMPTLISIPTISSM